MGSHAPRPLCHSIAAWVGTGSGYLWMSLRERRNGARAAVVILRLKMETSLWLGHGGAMKRSALIEALAERIACVERRHPVRVAIDGVDGVGKTTLADELVDPVRRHGLPVIRASVDGFHNPRSVRYRLGRSSPEGYFRDSFNYAALTAVLLDPLGPGGSRRYRRAIFNYRTDSEVATPFETAAPDTVLLFDGVFLLRPELRSYWDLSIFLDAPFEVTIPRAAHRDGGSPDVTAIENLRYVEGQKLYLQTCEPKRVATILIDNENLASPEIW
jgi:uridine kinase